MSQKIKDGKCLKLVIEDTSWIFIKPDSAEYLNCAVVVEQDAYGGLKASIKSMDSIRNWFPNHADTIEEFIQTGP